LAGDTVVVLTKSLWLEDFGSITDDDDATDVDDNIIISSSLVSSFVPKGSDVLNNLLYNNDLKTDGSSNADGGDGCIDDREAGDGTRGDDK
jgi:hypothetical protein